MTRRCRSCRGPTWQSSGSSGAQADGARPHSAEEVAWLNQAVRVIVRRSGEVAADPEGTFDCITMGDLPHLPRPREIAEGLGGE